MHRFSREKGHGYEPRGVRALLERPPSVREADWADAALDHFDADPALEWVPVLDAENCPVALAGRPLGLEGEPRLAGVDRIEPDLSFAAAATRAISRHPSERLVPFLRCDSRGRYVAIVRIERVIAELADIRPPDPLRSPAS